MMARVYIVLEDEHYEDTYICGVYADERDAADEVRRLEKEHLDEYEGYRTSSFYYAEWKVREPQETNQTEGKKSEPQDTKPGGR